LSLSLWFSSQNPVCIPLYPPHTPRSLHILFVISSSESSVSTNEEAACYTIPPTHSKTATTVIGHKVCGRQQEYFCVACWRFSKFFTYYHHNPLRSDIALQPVWTTEENPALTAIRYEELGNRSAALYWLRYRASEHFVMRI
jgi:hypothetical protein